MSGSAVALHPVTDYAGFECSMVWSVSTSPLPSSALSSPQNLGMWYKQSLEGKIRAFRNARKTSDATIQLHTHQHRRHAGILNRHKRNTSACPPFVYDVRSVKDSDADRRRQRFSLDQSPRLHTVAGKKRARERRRVEY